MALSSPPWRHPWTSCGVNCTPVWLAHRKPTFPPSAQISQPCWDSAIHLSSLDELPTSGCCRTGSPCTVNPFRFPCWKFFSDSSSKLVGWGSTAWITTMTNNLHNCSQQLTSWNPMHLPTIIASWRTRTAHLSCEWILPVFFLTS